MAKNKNVLFFSDFGIDDFVAAIYALFSEEVNIVGIVADYGNISRLDALRNAVYLREVTGIADIPVFSGAELPLTGEDPVYYPDVHGLEGLGPISLPEYEVKDEFFENFDGIKDIIAKYEDNIMIVNVGRLSSLATAFILYPSYMSRVKDFYIMGGAFNVPGNVSPVAEANFYGDPYAANIIIRQAPKQVHIIPLDVTMSAIVTPILIDRLDEYYKEINSKPGLLVKPMVDYYYKFYKKRDPEISGSPLHDVFTLWALTEGAAVEYKELPVIIQVDKGEGQGQSIGDFRKFIEKAEYPVHKVAISFDYAKFITSFYTTMKNHYSKKPPS
jgi:purine nucleosidase